VMVVAVVFVRIAVGVGGGGGGGGDFEERLPIPQALSTRLHSARILTTTSTTSTTTTTTTTTAFSSFPAPRYSIKRKRVMSLVNQSTPWEVGLPGVARLRLVSSSPAQVPARTRRLETPRTNRVSMSNLDPEEGESKRPRDSEPRCQ